MNEQMIYRHLDLILPSLDSPCDVKIVVDEHHVRLYIGPRDWQWNRNTGQFVGAGTMIRPPQEPTP